MKRRIVIKENQNPEKNFFIIRHDVAKIAEERGIPATEVIDELIEDLQNFRNPDYEKKVEEIDILGEISDRLLSNLKVYVSKIRKAFQDKEKRQKRQSLSDDMEATWLEIAEIINKAALEGKQGTKKEIIEKLITDINEGNIEYEFKGKEKKFILKKLKGTLEEIAKQEQEEKDKEEAKKTNAGKAMLRIQEIVDREYKAGNIKNKANYLSTIRDAITGEGIDLGVQIEEGTEQHLLQMLDTRIRTERDELYFEQVRSFTNDFQFLRDYSEVVRARHGAGKTNKFTDTESYMRFTSLRNGLQKEYNEHMGIELLLKSKKIDDVDRRILLARKEVLDREIEEKRKSGEIR